jgi:hypothetical protein
LCCFNEKYFVNFNLHSINTESEIRLHRTLDFPWAEWMWENNTADFNRKYICTYNRYTLKKVCTFVCYILYDLCWIYGIIFYFLETCSSVLNMNKWNTVEYCYVQIACFNFLQKYLIFRLHKRQQ